MFFYLWILFLAPGIIMHELSHAMCCVLSGTRIFNMKLFGFQNPPGYVEHAQPEKFIHSFIISMGPLIFNSLAAMLIFAQVPRPIFEIKSVILFWLAIAFGLNAVPSMGDTKTLFASANKKIRRNPLIIVAYPFIGVLFLLNILKRWHVHVVYVGALWWLSTTYLKV
jgi:hypothetical protein